MKRCCWTRVCILLAASSLVRGQQYVISTFAGGQPPPDPIAASGASLGPLSSIATDQAGNLYLLAYLSCIFKLDRNGVLTRVAGACRRGYSGDGGPATDAQFDGSGVALDSAGNLYIADTNNQRIRIVTTDGIITTAAGDGTTRYSRSGSSPGLIGDPTSVGVDPAGDVYILNQLGPAIQKLSPDGSVTTIATLGIAAGTGIFAVGGMAVDQSGNVYFADPLPFATWVQKVSAAGVVTTVVGTGLSGFAGDGGPATRAQLSNPRDVALDLAGNLYIADTGSYRIRKVSTGGIITTIAGNGGSADTGDGGRATSAQLSDATTVAVDTTGNLYIGDGRRIRRVSTAGIISTIAGDGTESHSGDGGLAVNAQLGGPAGGAFDSAGNLYFAETKNSTVRRISTDGTISTVAGNGTRGYSGDGGPATSAKMDPSSVAVDSAGSLYIAESNNSCIRKVSPDGLITTVAGLAGFGFRGFSGDGGPATKAQLYYPTDVVVDSSGSIYIADSGNGRVRRVSPDGVITTFAQVGTMEVVTNVAIDSSGNVYLSGNSVRSVSPDGVVATVPGTELLTGGNFPTRLARPGALAVDSGGGIYIAYSDGRIRKVSPNGVITIIAGAGGSSYSGDGGPATSAQLNPSGLALDAAGDVYVMDYTNNAIRMLQPAVP